MTNQEKIIRWLEEHQEEATRIAAHAVVPLLLDEDGGRLGESDFPSGADHIDHITSVMEAVGLYRYTDNLQENGKTD